MAREEGRRPVVSPVPDRPAEEEGREHNTNHKPPKPWCPYCGIGTGKRYPHKRMQKDVPDMEASIDKVPMLSVDYMYVYDKGEKPILVVVDHGSGRLWTYALRDKFMLRGDGWFQRRIVRDVENVGHKDVKGAKNAVCMQDGATGEFAAPTFIKPYLRTEDTAITIQMDTMYEAIVKVIRATFPGVLRNDGDLDAGAAAHHIFKNLQNVAAAEKALAVDAAKGSKSASRSKASAEGEAESMTTARGLVPAAMRPPRSRQ